jgi:hypothetical protein
MVARLVLLDETLAKQELHMAVIARALVHGTFAKLVHAAVADVRPICETVLNETRRASGARPALQGDTVAAVDDSVVGLGQGQSQEALWVEQRMCSVLEALCERVDRDLRGQRAAGVAAHAVDYDDQGAMLVRYDFDLVLIFLSVPDKREFR